jgi:nicotinamide mononucleotide adenylyltransferase
MLILSIQSTRVRAQIQNGERSMDVPSTVYKYITLHHLYQKSPSKEKTEKPAKIPNGKLE